jgi:heterodisulfide reductase subunit A
MAAPLPNMAAVTVDGRTSQVPIGTTILDAARQMGVAIPTLCHYRGMTPAGACRVCLVEIEVGDSRRMVSSCSYPIDGTLVVHSGSDAVLEARRTVLELLLAQAPDSQELKEFAAELGVESTSFSAAKEGRCVLCGLCTRVCNDVMGRGAINLYGRSSERKVKPAYDETTVECQVCGACEHVCPTGAIDLSRFSSELSVAHRTGYDKHLFKRPNIEMAHAQAAPRVPTIDRENCVYFKTGECGLCEKVCQAGAIDYDQEEETLDLEVGAVVLTPGFIAFDATKRSEFGLGFCDNVVSNVQFESLLSASGPTAGHVQRRSDGEAPKRLAFIQCIGSRDVGCGNEYCSSVCCMAATKEAIIAKDHDPNLDVTIFFLDMRAFGKDFDRYYQRAQDAGVRYVRSFISRIFEMPDSKNLQLTYLDSHMKRVEEEFDMVVLSLALVPSPTLREKSEMLGVDLNQWGFAKTTDLNPLDTSRPGVFVGGVFQEPKDIPDTVMQSSGSAARAMSLLASVRGSKVRTKAPPPERDVTDEPPRVGVFVCHCGSNIASVVDVAAVVEQTRDLPNVVLAEHNTYTCADDTQDLMKDRIIEHRLNRVIVASCTPRTHEAIFRDTLRDAGLNPYLLEMTNIRDQCSWVHSADPEQATQKAIDLVRMTLGRVVSLRPIHEQSVPVKSSALIIGGGIAGMTSALAIADEGFPVYLVEKESTLGGTAKKVVVGTLDGSNVQAFVADLAKRISAHPRIVLHTGSHVTEINGHVGSFESTIESPDSLPLSVEHGVVVVATGAVEQKPTSFEYGNIDKVITQSELCEKLAGDDLRFPSSATVVMIQCVEQRDEERPYCSRICCTTAVRNALQLKERQPDLNVVVLYRDMRTYGFREAAYQEAREKGVLFVRYEKDEPPQLTVTDDAISVRMRDLSLQRDLTVNPELVVLAAPIVGQDDRQEISNLLKVPLNGDGFFLEAHVKLRPVDFSSEGLFLCGAAHSPKLISEAISQACAVAGRVASILSKKEMPISGQVAQVDVNKCIACMTCVHLCPYHAPAVGKDNKAEVQNAACMGCGSCASGCPARAITLNNYTNDQISGAIESLLWAGSPPPSPGPIYPEKTGISQTRWHKRALEGGDQEADSDQ